MSSLLGLLAQSGMSLGAHSAASATASHNLQNANTPGYARQREALSAVIPSELVGGAFVGRGVELLTIAQARDRFLEAQIPGALAAAASSSAEAEALRSVAALDPDAAGGMVDALGAFFSSLRQLSQDPGNTSLRTAVIASAQGLGHAFNRTAQELDDARVALDRSAEGRVASINAASAAMAELNRSIRVARASGAEPNDLLDARLRLRDELAALTGASAVPDGDGNINMVLPGGGSLVGGDRAAQLGTTPNAANGGHVAITLRSADGQTRTLTSGSLGGTLGGELAARDGALAQAQAALDALAFDVGGALNAVHRGGVGLDGSTGRDLFSVGATAAGAARRIQVDPAVLADSRAFAASSSGATGDGANLAALLSVEQQAGEGLGRILSDYGVAAQGADIRRQHGEAQRDHLQALRESASGVSIDEELIHMTQAQRAYEAVMRVIKTADEMLGTLMELK
ncbi:MAG: flagellar hook-associated protein FlgK [Myxococcota bacterium]